MTSWALVAVVAIVMVCLVEMVKHRHRGLGRKEKVELESRLAQLESDNQILQERVAVLERIVTDRGFDLDQQIRDLG
ncbi:hypothetical protein [Ferrimonas gelatinilytica]|uniref:Phage shock protein B n=1 Tax=Ferrimonas gelatinilytica TaxID=1255257 RepID=A0ABP9S6V9_9GAMM